MKGVLDYIKQMKRRRLENTIEVVIGTKVRTALSRLEETMPNEDPVFYRFRTILSENLNMFDAASFNTTLRRTFSTLTDIIYNTGRRDEIDNIEKMFEKKIPEMIRNIYTNYLSEQILSEFKKNGGIYLRRTFVSAPIKKTRCYFDSRELCYKTVEE